MPIEKKLEKPSKIQLLENHPEIKSTVVLKESIVAEVDPDVIPGKEPFEKPPYEIPSPGEGP